MNNIKLPNIDTFKYAKQLLLDSKVVAFPTETVYGLGANALDTKALEKIFILKNRPSNNPLILHLWDKDEISKYGTISNPIEQKIIQKLMPWPITILLHKKENIPNLVSSNPYVGIRIPSNQVSLDFLKYCKLPIAAPSANISTKPSPTSAQMVHNYFGEKLPLIIDWWNCHVWIESTVIKVDEISACNPMWVDDYIVSYKITIMRPWFVTKEDLELLFNKNKNVSVQYSLEISNISPWNMYKHYSPRASIKIIQDLDILRQYSKIDEKKIALILTNEFITENKNILSNLSENFQIISWWYQKDLITCAQSLFEIYHQCDQKSIDLILIEQLKEEWLWFSIMNRVKKSAEK
jgi:L-threonylcarbamoyladenylate synthase